MVNTLNISAYTSLALQFITGVFEAQGLAVTVAPEDNILKEILGLELIVQLIEFVFYIYLIYLIIKGQISNTITSHRYIDWAITTPTMLVNFVVLFKYLNGPPRKIGLFESVKEDSTNIIKIVVANALMLLLGYLAERSIIDTSLGVALGFIPFAYVFKKLYGDYAKGSNIATTIFYVSFFIWAMYGVGAVLPFAAKNTMYNILDFFAKNAYGLFLYFFLKSKEIEN
jgi:bacteriorhodopsin